MKSPPVPLAVSFGEFLERVRAIGYAQQRSFALTRYPVRWLSILLLPLVPAVAVGVQPDGQRVGVVCNIHVQSDKVPDVSSIDAWKKSVLKAGMSDQDKALAAWRTTVMFQHQDVPPREYLQHEEVVQDPVKV